ncbi:eukaryotic translation initiation factor 4 gamma 3-like isoform X2 [Coccinella septempunctata]|uniref:eukaryotic translation initiation factor 4 gamma 3-like isoform X2 n=1 Tax=Coccinella septempunctata TaxID=41139 RepID=UPI001D0882EF|nr:eukaryotic translation initiation factor 4 gamma 3-like isoform X2 [Coccinella septempunctata]
MSGNPKQSAAGGQQIRYPTTYQPMQQPLPPRDNFLQNQNYVQQPNQASSQGVGLRGIAQTGPPNQAPTPPNQDIKVQAVPQQAPMSIYPQQNTARSAQQFYNRPTGPPNQNARMANNPQRIYQNSPHQFMQVPPMASNVYISPFGIYNPPQQRQNYVQPQVALLQSQHYPAYQPFTQPQLSQTPQSVAYQYFQIARPGPPPQPASNLSNPNQAPIASSMPLPQPVIPQATMPRQHKQRRPNAISIIDPSTGRDQLDEMFQQDNSHPPSGESSARQTPQPPTHNQHKDMMSSLPPFNKPVSCLTNEGELITVEFEVVTASSEGAEEFHDLYSLMPQQPPSSRSNAKFDYIAQTSNLKAHAKEFVLPSAKEPPVVSANCDSVEVTLNKLQKGRESPVRARKVKEVHEKVFKDSYEVPEKTYQSEKQQTVIAKEESEPPVSNTKETLAANINQHSSKVTEKESDKRKKDFKSDNKQTSEISPNDNTKQANQEHDTVAVVSKSKQNSSQKKDNHKNNNQRPNVPSPQPAKSSSKTIKKNEINSKGASKEGNDMDVFQISDTANANTPSPITSTTTTNQTDFMNANTTIKNNVTTTVNDQNDAANDNAAKAESNQSAPAKPTFEVKTTQKKWEVTNVFMGRFPGPSPYVPSLTENNNQDETDRAVVTNDRAVTAVNENSVPVPTQVADKKSQLPYKQGQWSPFNLDGNKKYDREFLMAIRDLPTARVKPPNLPETLEYSEAARQRAMDNRDNRSSNMMGKDFTAPPFMPFGGKNSSMKGSTITKHPSLSGKLGNKGGKSVNGGNKISISLREDIKLHETENAWKPGRLAKSENKSEEERKTEELYKKVRGVLNKLTPQKFDTLLNQIKALKVDNFERLQGVINLVFEKAIDEPNFAVAYAKMCMEVGLMQVTKINDDGKEELVNFRKLLITRCQEEFEKQSRDESKTEDKIKEIQQCQDPDKKKELEEELEETRRRIRMRSVGNVRFIGELFKINMLTVNIMTVCMSVLLTHKDEESLECLCRLLTTIGRKLEESKDISSYFDTMQKIVDGKEVSSRIRFMLQDVIDLRKNKWVPRRQDAGPKTIDQIARDVATEQLNSQIMNSVPSTPRRDDREMGRSKMRNNQDEWNSHQKPSFLTVNKDKLKHGLTENETLGQSAMFQKWNKGSTFKPAPVSNQHVTNTSNRFSCLENTHLMENDKKISGGNGGGRYKDSAYNSKGSSLERGSYGRHNYDSRGGSRSGSQHRMNDGAGPSGVNIPGPNLMISRSSAPPQTIPKSPTPPPTVVANKMTEDQLKRYCKNCCDEYINDNCTFEECESDIRSNVPPTYMATMVSDAILDVLETSKAPRMKLGLLLGKLLVNGTVPLQELCKALKDIFREVEDLIIDIPTIFTCLAEILVPIIIEGSLPLTDLQRSCSLLAENAMGEKMLLALFKLIVCEKGPNYLKELWQSSNLKLTDFMPENCAENFIQANQLEFLMGGTPVQGNSELNYEQIEKKLLEFFNSNTPFDDICMWITANVGKKVKENTFIRTLATAIYKYSIVRTKLNTERLSKQCKLFNKYVDNNPTYELQCLYALQSLVNHLEHPQGLLLSILNKLSEDSIFAQESFLSWESSKDPAEQEGKGVALNQLRAFFTQLKENDDDDDDYVSTGSDEA